MNNLGKGILFVISGPSGVGKGTILAQVFKHIRGLCYSVSMTTRKPREGEIDKVNYYFVSKEEFEKTIQEDGFYEYVNVLGNYYGTPKKAVMEKIAKGNDVVLEIETIGAKKVKDSKPDNLVSIFIAPPTLDELKAKLDHYLNSFKDPDVKLIANKVIGHFYDKYITYPAAVRVHHEFGSGILHHSLAMADLAEAVAKLYPQIDRDILICGCLIHDIGKTVEYEKPLTPSVTVEGKLAGHISIMYAEFKKIVDPLNIKSEVPLLLEHMILSHHGTHEFGSPVLPSTREAMLLSMIDLLDSRMMVLDKALGETKPGEFSQKIWAMDNICFYKPKDRNK